ncbi:YihY/virulence factor BrkB family protein [Iodidimonas sp. MBR-22]|uniref:YihY/virulence factor BrkB family protein n=1 Tax=Iodidimonas sp. MBR-22 TaxID=3032320 RepID=UPI00248290CA|nr:YihY/virulence factor BrkB family protein [Iodidimonas sp. MBR-22]
MRENSGFVGQQAAKGQGQLSTHGRICWASLLRFFKNHGLEDAGNLAFLGVMALFPFLIFMIALSGFIGQTDMGQDAIRFLLTNLPQGIAQTLEGPIDNILKVSGGGLLTGSIAFALWSAVQGVEGARKTVIHAFGSWHHAAPFWRRLLADLALIIITALAILLAMSFLVAIPVTLSFLSELFYLPQTIRDYSIWARYIAAPLLLFLALLALYKNFTPRLPRHRRHYVPGALFTVLVWLLLGKGMTVFLNHADRYDVIYGSLAGMVILQLFIYIIAAAFILGAHLNAGYSRHHHDLPSRLEDQDEQDDPAH